MICKQCGKEKWWSVGGICQECKEKNPQKKPRFSNDPNLIEVYGTTLGETDLAIYFDAGTRGAQWLPKSELEEYPEKDQTGECLMPEWLAEEKEFI